MSAAVKKRASGRQQAALKVHSSMMRDLAGLRWQSQRRRRRPSGQRRPSTKPSRGRAWVTHTAAYKLRGTQSQTAVSAISRGREGRLGAGGGGRSTDDADAAECFSTICNVLYPSYLYLAVACGTDCLHSASCMRDLLFCVLCRCRTFFSCTVDCRRPTPSPTS